MYTVKMNYLISFPSCSIRNLTLTVPLAGEVGDGVEPKVWRCKFGKVLKTCQNYRFFDISGTF